ncbi:hypothetical protein Rsub_00019 [Raphidocelis subcapitata]|uniref:Uncharacterized protein n=1 Tax=Raphidocelis subcapitata TaxID=307507 RepID=A0A2V0NJC6_9CHLO|nr:hypothetical protein Rsub_00019 [Raphidocelis subcapitata]|eukprot:GBF87308.1 hypothetical protein Rsub_00019 [Raphidocelis subcapitata]
MQHSRAAAGPRQAAARNPAAPPARAARLRAGAVHHGAAGGTAVVAAAAAAGGAATSTTTAPRPEEPRRPPLGQQQQQQRQPPRSASGRPLQSPARVFASGQASCRVRDAGGAVSLASYMLLPPEQYALLDPSQMSFLNGNTFRLAVPAVNILGAQLRPLVDVTVSTTPDAVVLRGARCRLRGSGAFASLDEKFSMEFETSITWAGCEGQPAAPGAPAGSGRRAWRSLRSGIGQWAAGGGGGGDSSGDGSGVMTGTTSVEVYCEVVPPFNLMPREAMEGSCNAVLGGLVRSLLPVFMRQLAADYQRWAVDEAYRRERAARGRPHP